MRNCVFALNRQRILCLQVYCLRRRILSLRLPSSRHQGAMSWLDSYARRGIFEVDSSWHRHDHRFSVSCLALAGVHIILEYYTTFSMLAFVIRVFQLVRPCFNSSIPLLLHLTLCFLPSSIDLSVLFLALFLCLLSCPACYCLRPRFCFACISTSITLIRVDFLMFRV